jgi:protein-L-isoaspartate O-methyltransferase
LSWIPAKQDSIMKTQRFDCKLGDQVLRRVGNKTFKGIITGIAKENEHKLLLDIEVGWSDGKTAQISPFDRDLIILATSAETPERLFGYLKKHGLLWARVTARDHWTYRMVSANNHAELRAVIVESQSCDVIFTVKSGKVTASERKPSLDESQTHLCVGKRRLPLDEVEQLAEWQQFS